MVEAKFVPPDGGYGWVIVAACGLYAFIVPPIEKWFGLVFMDKFSDLGFSATNASTILNTNAATSMLVSVMVAPLLNRLGYRKVSFIAALFITTGVFLTAYANTFYQYILTHGLITSLGHGMGVQAYILVLNTYFIENRTKATGFTLTIAGFGSVIMPQIISQLMESYGVNGTVIIVAGISVHTFASALLLQPVQWHTKNKMDEGIRNTVEDNLLEKGTPGNAPLLSPRKKDARHHMAMQENMEMNEYQVCPQKEEIVLIENANTKSSDNKKDTSSDLAAQKNLFQEDNKTDDRSLFKITGKKLVDTFDLTLLKDPAYVNITIGLSLAIFSELNFSLLSPFIMREFGLTTQQIATFMSIVSSMEICFRFASPYIGKYISKSAKVMLMLALVLLSIARFCLFLPNNYYGFLCCGVFLGSCKGIRTLYWTLIIPNCVPIERLAAASGLHGTICSFVIWIGGPFLGFLKDLTGSYKNCIYVMNLLSFLTIILWSSEFAYRRYRSRRKYEQR